MWNTTAGVVTRLQAGELMICGWIPSRGKSRTVLRSMQLPIQWVPGALSLDTN
jgi:hypothetical protein